MRPLLPLLSLLALACTGKGDDSGAAPWQIDITPDDFAGGAVDNPLFPLPVGATWTLEGQTEDGLEHIEIEVLPDTKTVAWGIEVVVVRDTVTIDGALAEDTWDWFAQDNDGNVWYFGEETCEYEDGVCVDRHGEWEAGVDGALPGIQMSASPAVGDTYHQEYLAGEAEDEAEVLALDEAVETPAGSFTGCVKTREWTDLEPDVYEHKWACPGLGTVREENPDEGWVIALTASSLQR